MTDSQPLQVEPLDEDGVGAVALGTGLWLAALGILLLFHGRLSESDSEWWIWVAATGAALGVPGLWYTRRRRSAYRSARPADSQQGSN